MNIIATPALEGGQGDNPPSRGDVVLTGQAIRAGWDIPTEARQLVIREMQTLLANGSNRQKIAASRVLLLADSVNTKRESLESKTRRSLIVALDDAELGKVGQRTANARLFRAIASDEGASRRDRILAARELGKLLGLNRTEDEMSMVGVGEMLFSLMRTYRSEEAAPPAPRLLPEEAPEAGHAT